MLIEENRVVVEAAVLEKIKVRKNLKLILGLDEQFIVDKVIKGFKIVRHARIIQIGTQADELGDNKEVVLGEVDSSGMPIPFIRFMLREPCNRIIIGGFSDG